MHIQQVKVGKEQIVGAGLSIDGNEKTSQIDKTGSILFPEAAQQKIEKAQTIDTIAQKAKSMTESVTGNHAEYIVQTMTPGAVESAEKEGMDLSDEDEDMLVTVVDKIQLQMIEGGNEAVMATADLDADKIQAMTGNQMSAYDMATALTTPSTEEIVYLVKNELEPTIGNFYQAQSVAVTHDDSQQAKQIPVEEIIQPIQQKLEELGIEINEENVNRALMMVQSGIGLTKENYHYVEQLESLTFPLTQDQITQAVMNAVILGRAPAQGMLIEDYTWQNRAIQSNEVIENATEEDLLYLIEYGEDITIENLTRAQSERSKRQPMQTGTLSPEQELRLVHARKNLEQVRLLMSAEANLSLLRKGIHIETEGMEQLIQELSDQEEQLQTMLYHTAVDGDYRQAQEQYQHTCDALTAFQNAPAYHMQEVTFDQTLLEVEDMLSSKEPLADYGKAEAAYETMMTQVRPDLGDSIQEAFRNVDDILEDLNLAITSENERAVRILAYNHTELTVDNILMMKEKDEQLQTLFHNMTPKVVLGMIREGYNPLDVSLQELNQKAAAMKQELDPIGADSYSKFLVQLENRNELTQEERDSYIGIYRLLHQVAKSDGAAVGAVVLSDEKMTMRNLMTQVRNQRAGKIDVIVDSKAVGSSHVADLSITQQVEASYQSACLHNAKEEMEQRQVPEFTKDPWEMTPEELLEELRTASKAETEQEAAKQAKQIQSAYQMLQGRQDVEQFIKQMELPKSAQTITAVAEFLNNRNQLYRSLYKREKNLDEQIRQVKEDLWDNFAENVKTPEDMAKAQEELAKTAESVMEGMLNSEEVTDVDIRQLKLERQQLGILSQMAKKEEYAVPVLVADEMGCVSLKIVRGKEDKGKVSITTQLEYGKVAAEFAVTANGIRGYVVTDNKELTERFMAYDQELENRMKEELGQDNYQCNYVTEKQLSLEQFSETKTPAEQGKASDVQTKALYGMARLFLTSLSKGVFM